MEITFADILLASPNLVLGAVGPYGVALNDEQVVQEVLGVRATAARFFGRGNRSTMLQFSSTHLFTSEKAASLFALQPAAELPGSGDLVVVCGPEGDQETIMLEDAVLPSAVVIEHLGLAVRVRYTFRGGVWSAVA